MEMRNFRILTAVVVAMTALNALYLPLIFGSAWLFRVLYGVAILPHGLWLDQLATLFKIATGILLLAWVYRAGRNLADLGVNDLEFTPDERVWWFAVPFANLVVPYQGMRELWNASRGRRNLGETEPLVVIWWGIWLARCVEILLARFVADRLILLLLAITEAALALVAIQLVREIAANQARLRSPRVAEVFA
ncbi:DUF4328 domain-containing protein [Sphingomonas sp. R-74633]|uniref:DUF4328 domain-containing protein n=1 Tax=Sphingomonas sp. R-74633 TaxID=2751188 RepID=UPI0015D36EAB|nr:DUF4328 domain-containing protein [Sphingomonas sp. R-74633]NYT39428.1 DUF4328 domain-containing protein [Sphingomonas sp. R-74633]